MLLKPWKLNLEVESIPRRLMGSYFASARRGRDAEFLWKVYVDTWSNNIAVLLLDAVQPYVSKTLDHAGARSAVELAYLGVRGCARRGVHDAGLLAGQRVDEGGLAGVHAAKDADVGARHVRALGGPRRGRPGLRQC